MRFLYWKKKIPHFLENIKGKKIIDFGCGGGLQVFALAKAGASAVVGIDTNPRCLTYAFNQLNLKEDKYNIQFMDKIDENNSKANFDICISQNSFEHFPAPVDTLNKMKELVSPGGKIYITFGPTWFSPYGAHLHFMTKLPWVNIFFSEKTIMNVRSNYRTDGAKKFSEVEGGLNKMTVKKFNKIIKDSKLKINYINYDCVKGLNFFSKLPLLNELFINHITCVLEKESACQ